ncbi:hypothetical protein Kpol_1033p60 [Vanderwaltozyma polyspora DSM 70294]|uniref:MYND-type domain-containing protein n=1 Tax=Vanderwaltozyma polyspora (strain ATCC 22028 / DSM 70294 / BCRC 21397 / CBS 2163 / NBRC 10782 / NRRL Y-8283 / UCD 57-17) TaxID=436907 RepID=A7TJ54_VANPO|nr:uncharacterized protein Kpol_1033p60 [Vanderwaltozyma polyspora DSM 70294]EDO17753.1 hypothetical protein Kpol_1033p60 [Vanderwaltozyma polyspora DSM 70294]
MRETNHRSVILNKPVVTISSTVYDRRALDTNSDVPLINSLNHLTYLTSNSSKVRETVSEDGALDRLVSILHCCYLNLNEILDYNLKKINKHERARSIWKEKKLAMYAWKWTLAFQCLVLTGTRGTEQIRNQVVSSGVIPLLATVLDNYLIYHKNYDFIRNCHIHLDFNSLTSRDVYMLLKKDTSETYEQYISYLIGETFETEEELENFFKSEELLLSTEISPSDFSDIWNLKSDLVSSLNKSQKLNNSSNDEEFENCFRTNSDHIPLISVPREFYLGRIIPKQDDVIWSLQLLAFISKYTYMKEQLQNVNLVDSLSFRSIIDRVQKRMDLLSSKNNNNINKNDNPNSDIDINNNIIPNIPISPIDIHMEDAYNILSLKSMNIDEPFLMELKETQLKCLQKDSKRDKNIELENPYKAYSIEEPNVEFSSDRIVQENTLREGFEQKWDYKKISKELTRETWISIITRFPLNLFPLVERFTVTNENPHDMIYWSSVIMRNSCRKNEITCTRQCANFECGKWESFPRQFAKCRRCKRTKYCSRQCQLKAWTFHRYWCHEVGTKTQSNGTTYTTGNTPNGNNSEAASTSNLGVVTESNNTDTTITMNTDRILTNTTNNIIQAEFINIGNENNEGTNDVFDINDLNDIER